MASDRFDYSHVEEYYAQYDVSDKDDSYIVGWHHNDAMLTIYDNLLSGIDLDGCSVLDIGCGTGALIEFVKTHKKVERFEYLGVDILPEMIAKASDRYPNYRFEVRDVLKDPMSESFDWVVLSGVVHLHFDRKEIFWREILRYAFSVCKKGVVMNFLPQFLYEDLGFFDQLGCEHTMIDTNRVHQFSKTITPHVSLFLSTNSTSSVVKLYRHSSDMASQTKAFEKESLSTEETVCKDLFYSQHYQKLHDYIGSIDPSFLCTHYYCLSKIGLGEVDLGISTYTDLLTRLIDVSQFSVSSRQLGCVQNDYGLIIYFLRDVFELFPEVGKLMDLSVFDAYFICLDHQAFFRAWQLYFQGDFSSCVPLCRQVLSQFPHLYRARYILAKSYVALDQPLSAIYHFHTLLLGSSTFQFVLPELIALYLKLGQQDVALDVLNAQPPSDLVDRCRLILTP